MTIKHIVISGGGEVGFIIQGLLTRLYNNKVWHHDDIQTLYSTSVGTLIGLGIVLKIEIETINKYILQRPLNFLQIEPQMFFGLIENKGLFDKTVILKFCSPLLKSLDLDVNITFKELYEFSGIDYNVIVSELNNFESVQFSHKTHPEFKVLDAISMSCALPTLFKPIVMDDKCYFDGGLFNNFPIGNCLKENNCNIDEILAFKKCGKSNSDNNKMSEIKNIFDYINTILGKMIIHFNNDGNMNSLSGDNIYEINAPQVSVESIIGLMDKEVRMNLFKQGYDIIENNNADISLNNIDISQNDLSNNSII